MIISRKKFEAIIGECINEFGDPNGPLFSTDGKYIQSNRFLSLMIKLGESRLNRDAAEKKE